MQMSVKDLERIREETGAESDSCGFKSLICHSLDVRPAEPLSSVALPMQGCFNTALQGCFEN